MSEAISKTTMVNDVTTKLREQIKNHFIGLITDEQWDELIREEVKRFMEPKVIRDGYSGRVTGEQPSEFSVLARAEITELFRSKLRAEIAKMQDSSALVGKISTWIYDNQEAVLSQFIKDMFKRGSDVVASQLSYQVANYVQTWLSNNR